VVSVDYSAAQKICNSWRFEDIEQNFNIPVGASPDPLTAQGVRDSFERGSNGRVSLASGMNDVGRTLGAKGTHQAMATSNEDPAKSTVPRNAGELEHPPLELRRSSSRPKSTPHIDRSPEGAAIAPVVLISLAPNEIPAIYRIERAAIRLRRLRWEQKKAPAAKGSNTPDESDERKELIALLSAYTRPSEDDSSAPTSFARKVGMRVRAFFKMRGAQKL